MSLEGFRTDNPVEDAERYYDHMEMFQEGRRADRVIRCTAKVWMTFEHVTSEEAVAEAQEFFANLFRDVDDSEFECEEEKG